MKRLGDQAESMWLSFSTIMEKYGMDLKEPKTFAELVSRLKEHHMEVEDELFAG